MKPITRKQFLLSLMAGASSVAISACEQRKTKNPAPTATKLSESKVELPTPVFTLTQEPASTATNENPDAAPANKPPHPNPTETSLPIPNPTDTQSIEVSPTSLPTDTIPAPTNTPMSIPDLVVARGGDDPETIVRRAVAAMGGMELFVPKGAKVIIKPNICTAYHTYEYASTTNPWVIGALVKMSFEAGASNVSVMDFPFGGTPEDAYEISGIKEQVEASGGKMVVMSKLQFPETQIPNGQKIKKWPIYEEVLKADVFINVPIAKNHGLTILTLGMKNLMGIVQNRENIHSYIGQKLADLASLVYPTLTIVDAVRILTYGGPTGGDLNAVKKLDTIIASRDIIAADSYAASLFNIKPDEINYIKAGADMGLGRSDLQNLKIEEITVGG